MKNHIKILTFALMTSLLILLLISCGVSNEQQNVVLNKTSLELIKGESFKLSLTENDIIITDGLEWSSSDESIASAENGNVIAKKEGLTTVSCKYKDKTYKVGVTVLGKPKLSLESIKIEKGSYKEISLNAGNYKIERGVEWSSDNENVAKVENGKVTGVGTGDTVIRAKYENKTYICTVEVKEQFNFIGKFTCNIVVSGMDNQKFDFELIIDSDKTYTYTRLKTEGYDEWKNTGDVEYNDGTLILKHSSGKITLKVVDEDTVQSVGKIITGGMDSELTFKRAQEKK